MKPSAMISSKGKQKQHISTSLKSPAFFRLLTFHCCKLVPNFTSYYKEKKSLSLNYSQLVQVDIALF